MLCQGKFANLHKSFQQIVVQLSALLAQQKDWVRGELMVLQQHSVFQLYAYMLHIHSTLLPVVQLKRTLVRNTLVEHIQQVVCLHFRGNSACFVHSNPELTTLSFLLLHCNTNERQDSASTVTRKEAACSLAGSAWRLPNQNPSLMV